MSATRLPIEQGKEGEKEKKIETGEAERTESFEEKQRPPSLDLFFETVHAFYKTESLKAAIQLDVFTAIGEGLDTTSTIATRCDASERGIRVLCDFLTLTGFLRKQRGARFELTPDSKAFLDRRSPTTWAVR